jgi:hypothetical protein
MERLSKPDIEFMISLVIFFIRDEWVFGGEEGCFFGYKFLDFMITEEVQGEVRGGLVVVKLTFYDFDVVII